MAAMAAMEPTLQLPKEIAEHYARHGVDRVEEYLVGDRSAVYRFVRLNPRYAKEETISLLRKELASSSSSTNATSTDSDTSTNFPLAVPWLNERLGFYALPADFGLARSVCFREGRIYGMDISSGAAVAALLLDDHDVKPHQEKTGGVGQVANDASADDTTATCTSLRVLDLCCSPGLKLCAMADLLSNDSTVVGVDINESRISLCKKIITKYQINRQTSGNSACNAEDVDNSSSSARVRLYCQDGTQFGLSSFRDDEHNLVFDSEIAREDERVVAGKRKRMNKSARARQQKRLRTVAHLDFVDNNTTKGGSKSQDDEQEKVEDQNICCHLFDRVLVDAECSTDGAITHLKHKMKQQQNSAYESVKKTTFALSKSGISKLGDEGAMADLVDLQQRLIFSGFRLLKRGGALVYSTCSLSEEQNEGVVNWLLKQCPDAFITPVSFGASDGNDGPKEENLLISEGNIPGTVRFRPKLLSPSDGDSKTSTSSEDALLFGGGFWLAKIGKR
mmetsp:Transcript_6763/g.18879  ORF Transcript_6763/g.18879 Transcript_6763/m.18879 type:complete len:506 (-) Transcript_6763:41-1558(-)